MNQTFGLPEFGFLLGGADRFFRLLAQHQFAQGFGIPGKQRWVLARALALGSFGHGFSPADSET